MTDISVSTLATPQTVAMKGKMSARETMCASAVAGGRARRRLSAQWYKDAEGVLAMRWTTAVELDEDHLPAALAA
jgi:hypothetical protein